MASADRRRDNRRGRASCSPRGSTSVLSQRLFTPMSRSLSRERSPHVSMDRITRHASPSRQDLAKEKVEVVSRIPQPYRTSFSAVTSPRRVSRSDLPNAVGSQETVSSHLVRDGPIRASMPARLRTGSASGSERSRGISGGSVDLDSSLSDRSVKNSKPNSCNLDTDQENRKLSGRMLNVSTDTIDSGRLTANSVSGIPAKCAERQSCQDNNLASSWLVTTNHHNALDTTAEFKHQNSTMNGDLSCDPSSVNTMCQSSASFEQTPERPQTANTATVQKKLLICKEYVHVYDASYLKTLEKERKNELLKTDKKAKGLTKGFKLKKKSRSKAEKSGSDPAALHIHEPDPAKRSSMVNPGTVTESEHVRPVRKSLSTSITNFLKRMSPKTLRRSSKGSDRGSLDSTDGSSLQIGHASDDVDRVSLESGQSEDITEQHIDKSIKTSSIKQCINTHDGYHTDESDPTVRSLPCEQQNKPKSKSNASVPAQHYKSMFKSIEDCTHATQEKSVYQTFKDKQSPLRSKEAIPLKPQALKAVEFPDNLLCSTSSANGEIAIVVMTDETNSTPVSPYIAAEGVDDEVGSLGSPCSKTYRKQQPPRSLNVREVNKLNKAIFTFPSMSAESIGQCSLDVYATGSEPSLASRNGQRSSSSVTASKRTLASTENITANGSTKSAAELCAGTGSQNASPAAKNSLPAVETIEDETDDASKSPSYLKISCALGGYNKYSGYCGSPSEQSNKTRVVNDTEQCVTNGHVQAWSNHDLDTHNKHVSSHHSQPAISNQELNTARVHYPNKNANNRDVKLRTGDRHGNENNDVRTVNNYRNSTTAVTSESPGNIYEVNRNLDIKTADRTSEQDRTRLKRGSQSEESHIVENGPLVTSCNSEGHCSLDKQDTRDRSLNKASLSLHRLSSSTEESDNVRGSETQENLLQTPKRDAGVVIVTGDTPTPSKDGKYFNSVVDREEERIHHLCSLAEKDLQKNMHEEVSGKLRATIGKANLLTGKKFKQFRGLCDKNMNQSSDDAFQTTPQDLAGFWDMVLIQVEDVDAMFYEIDKLRKNNWREEKSSPSQKTAIPSATTSKGSVGKSKSSKPRTPTPKSNKSNESAKAREEARRRLLAAKKAGRQRKASQSDKEEVEIYIVH